MSRDSCIRSLSLVLIQRLAPNVVYDIIPFDISLALFAIIIVILLLFFFFCALVGAIVGGVNGAGVKTICGALVVGGAVVGATVTGEMVVGAGTGGAVVVGATVTGDVVIGAMTGAESTGEIVTGATVAGGRDGMTSGALIGTIVSATGASEDGAAIGHSGEANGA